MSLSKEPIRGIVETMDDVHHEARARSLSDALTRLSRVREERGPVGIVDPFEIVAYENRLAAGQVEPEPESKPRRFRFGRRVHHDTTDY